MCSTSSECIGHCHKETEESKAISFNSTCILNLHKDKEASSEDNLIKACLELCNESMFL